MAHLKAFVKLNARAKTLAIDALSILKIHNKKHANRNKTISLKTQKTRRNVIIQLCGHIHALGFRVDNVNGICQKHIRAVVQDWLKTGYAPGTVTNKLNIYRIFFHTWCGRRGVVPENKELFDSPELYTRKQASTNDKSWTGNHVDFLAVYKQIKESDPQVAIQLLLSLVFGLRDQEAAYFRPHECDKRDFIYVKYGTKNGLQRDVPVETQLQRDVLEYCKLHVVSVYGSTIPDDYTSEQWMRHYSYVLRKFGISKKDLGVTAHGLRHEFLIDNYEAITGFPAAIRGEVESTLENKLKDRLARKKTQSLSGHARNSITNAYLGPMVGRLSKKDKVLLDKLIKEVNQLPSALINVFESIERRSDKEGSDRVTSNIVSLMLLKILSESKT